MRRLFFQVFMLMRTHPESQASTTKPSAIFEARVLRPRLRVRRETRMRMGMRAMAMRVQSRAMKPARRLVRSRLGVEIGGRSAYEEGVGYLDTPS